MAMLRSSLCQILIDELSNQVYMAFARSIGLRSTCLRKQVGRVITSVDHRRVLAIGYNCNASGLPNTCDRDEFGNCGCLHSEENAVINCDAPRDTKKLVYITHMPCPACAKRLINLGNVVRVVYETEIGKKGGVDLLKTVGIAVGVYCDSSGQE